MNQKETAHSEPFSGLFDGLDNFMKYKEQSSSFKGRVVSPSGTRAPIINPNAKPIKLNPPT